MSASRQSESLSEERQLKRHKTNTTATAHVEQLQPAGNSSSPAGDVSMTSIQHTNGSSQHAQNSHAPTTTNTSSNGDATVATTIDEALYSRQLYVMGHAAQAKLSTANVLIYGLDGLGVETAKNLILAGPRAVYIFDPTVSTITDLASQFYITEVDVKQRRTRAAASIQQLQSLNSYVHVHNIEGDKFDTQWLQRYEIHCVALCNIPLYKAIELNDFCHKQNIQFIHSTVHGLQGSLFVDNGQSHTISDTTGETPKRGLIVHVSNATTGIVTVHEDQRHGLEDGDTVTFEEVDGMTELNDSSNVHTIKVVSPYSFSIGDTSKCHPFTGHHGYYQQVKQPTTVSSKTLKDTLYSKQPPIIEDWFGTSLTQHVLQLAISQYQQQHSDKLPLPSDDSGVQQIVQHTIDISKQHSWTIDEALVRKHARSVIAVIAPIAAVLGGIAAQEILKAVSGKFTPAQQYYYYDASTAQPDKELPASEYTLTGTRYDHYIAIFGKTLQQQVQSSQWFIVGAGAIGCEMIKNMALMGIGSAGKGHIYITDGDSIEKSNLNRQFLFRPKDVGQLKSVTAAAVAQQMNPDVKIHASNLRVEPASEATYSDSFWESLDGVCNALDNVEARMYVDSKCIYYQKPLIDSGTLGAKGSTQVIVPFLTESYGSSRDPPDEQIPICTLRNFPNKIEHTIQWARDFFEGLYPQVASDVNAYLTHSTYLQDLRTQPNIQLEKVKTLVNAIGHGKAPQSYDDCIEWARHTFDEQFDHAIAQLLHTFPPDHKTAEGTPFWSGPKRAPKPLPFDAQDPLHLLFVKVASRLRAEMYNIPMSDVQAYSDDQIRRVAHATKVTPFQAKSIKIAENDEQLKKQQEEEAQREMDVDTQVAGLVKQLPPPQTASDASASNGSANYTLLTPLVFEKDSETNGHIDFITAVANLRARNYTIKEADRHAIKGIAGKIIPAIATVTAIVTGLVCVELYKLLQKKPLESYRNSTVNLALPMFQAAEPIPPAKTTVQLKSGEWAWSLWDRIDVDLGGDVTLQQFVDHLTEKYGLEVNMLSYGASLLYSNFTAPKKAAERLRTRITDLIKQIAKYEVRPDEQYLILEPSVTRIDDDSDVEVPFVRYKFR